MAAKPLPYTTERTFHFRGQPYPSEEAALRASIEHVLGNAGIAAAVVVECCALSPLLVRACELGLGNQPARSE